MVLIDALLRPECYPHPVQTPIRLRQTHISWVLLTGSYAYKIKKPVNFGFLDFTTLAKRHFYCREELRLNRRLAAPIYLEVVPISGTVERPEVGGSGTPIEYAVKMRQFDERELLSERADRGVLTPQEIDRLADRIAHFHQEIPAVDPLDPYGRPEVVREHVRQNFAQINGHLYGEEVRERLERLKAWSEREGERLAPVMLSRREGGFVRECHGDLHLGNTVLWQGEPLPFDAIEFNPALRWIDLLSEVALTTMDLSAHRYRPFGFRFLNRYLWTTGDYESLTLLPYYLTYRAMVRAKIAHLTDPADLEGFLRYFRWAEQFSRRRRPFLILVSGVTGSGKSTLAIQLSGELEAIHLRSDVERKRLAGLHWSEPSRSGLGDGLYRPEMTTKTYGRLLRLAEKILQGGIGVVVDATFLRKHLRASFTAMARRLKVPLVILTVRAAPEILKARVEERLKLAEDASEATPEVLAAQLKAYEPPVAEEADRIFEVDTGRPLDLKELLREILPARERGSPPGSNAFPA